MTENAAKSSLCRGTNPALKKGHDSDISGLAEPPII